MITCVVFPNDNTGNSNGEPIAKKWPHKLKPRRPVKDDAAMAVLLLGGPTPNGYAARRTSFNATLSFAFRFLTR